MPRTANADRGMLLRLPRLACFTAGPTGVFSLSYFHAHTDVHPMMTRRGLRALRNITHESESNFSLATMRLEGEFSRRIGLTPLRACLLYTSPSPRDS